MTDYKIQEKFLQEILKSFSGSVDLDVVPSLDLEDGATVIITLDKGLQGIIRLGALALLASEEVDINPELKNQLAIFLSRVDRAFDGVFTDPEGNEEHIEDDESSEVVHATNRNKINEN